MNSENIKKTGRKILVDGASVAIFLVVCVNVLSGCGTLYRSFYETGKITPEVFASAGYAYTTATSFVYMLLLTRKYRVSEDKGECKDENKH